LIYFAKVGRAVRLKLILVREKSPPYHVGRPVGSPADAAQRFGPILADEAQEVFIAVAVNGRDRYSGHYEVSRGSLTTSIVHPREVFKQAILRNAAAIFLFHNHPTGDPSPSDEDVAVTRRLVHAGEVLGIRVLDHIIVGEGGSYASFTEKGLL